MLSPVVVAIKTCERPSAAEPAARPIGTQRGAPWTRSRACPGSAAAARSSPGRAPGKAATSPWSRQRALLCLPGPQSSRRGRAQRRRRLPPARAPCAAACDSALRGVVAQRPRLRAAPAPPAASAPAARMAMPHLQLRILDFRSAAQLWAQAARQPGGSGGASRDIARACSTSAKIARNSGNKPSSTTVQCAPDPPSPPLEERCIASRRRKRQESVQTPQLKSAQSRVMSSPRRRRRSALPRQRHDPGLIRDLLASFATLAAKNARQGGWTATRFESGPPPDR